MNIFINPENGKEYKCILFACDVRMGWEWFGFEKNGDVYFGFVHGFEDEFGYFSISGLRQNGIPVYTDPEDIEDIMPPIGWQRKEVMV